jgi:hypothetical protein
MYSFCLSKFQNRFLLKKTEKFGCSIFVLPSFANKFILNKIINYSLISVLRIIWCFFKINDDDVIIVYHSLALIKLIKIIKKYKKCKVIIEVGELYGKYVSDNNIIQNELKYLQCADGYIFQSEILNNIVNKNNRPYIINYGAYNEERINKIIDNNKIHCIYSGTFDEEKKGVYTAIETAKYLPENYIIHISGFGNEQQCEKVKKLILQNNNNNKCIIIYEGLLDEFEYKSLLNKCNIGLNTQDINADFNDSCFPSKIIKYLSFGLEVVSGRTTTIESSKVAPYLHFYEDQTGYSVAKSIILINKFDTERNINFIKNLNVNFQIELKKMIDDIQN